MKKILFIIAALTLSAGLWAETQTVSYDYPVYNTPNDPKSGIASWQTDEVEATVVESSDDVVYWGTEGQTTWYVVTSGGVQLTKGAVCRGDVHLILYIGALRASAENDKAGIEVSGSNSLTIYGQPSASLYAFGRNGGAGIGGGNRGNGSNITINGGNITAQGDGAGIGGGLDGNGSNITINGGQVTAYSSGNSVGIGGGNRGNGTNIIINGGTVTTQSVEGTAIGGGKNGQSSNIFVASSVLLKVGGSSKDAIETPHFTGYDMAAILKDKRYVMLEEGKATAYVEGYNAGKAELLGNMAEPCTGCTAVEVTDGTTTVTLYKPTNVSYIKKVKTP